MSFDNSGMLSGNFVSTGAAKFIPLRPGVDYMEVRNLTQTGATNNVGIKFEWYNGFQLEAAPNANSGIYTFKSGGGNTTNEDVIPLASNGFLFVNTADQAPTAPVAITASTNAVQPVFSTGSTAGLANGDVVRITNITAQPNISGYDFSIDTVVLNTSFRMENALATAPGAAGVDGFWRKIPFDRIFYPRKRSLLDIKVVDGETRVTVSVAHGFTVGQVLRFRVPAAFGMTQIDGLLGTVTKADLSANTTPGTDGQFEIDINIAGFTAFQFPLASAAIFTKAEVVPVGTSVVSPYENLFDDATTNVAQIGMVLAGGANLPGGASNDHMYWRALVSAKTYNEI